MKKKMILSEDRPKEVITLTMPADVICNLKIVAEAKGMSNFQSLIRFYVGQELRKDIADLKRKNPGSPENIVESKKPLFFNGLPKTGYADDEVFAAAD